VCAASADAVRVLLVVQREPSVVSLNVHVW
jgi:hypothetical protein